MRTDGIQEEENGMTEEKSHVRSMTEETTSKAVAKPKLRSPAKRPVSNGPQPSDGKLSKKNVQKLSLTRKHIISALATMDEQLLCAVRSVCIAPQLITKLTAHKEELPACFGDAAFPGTSISVLLLASTFTVFAGNHGRLSL